MNIEPGLLHKNQGYGNFDSCPFCGGEPYFSIQFYEWSDETAYAVQDHPGLPDAPAGFTATVCCPNCTISMHCPDIPRQGYTEVKSELLKSEFYQDKFGDLLYRWNRRVPDIFSSNLRACAHNLVVNLDPSPGHTINWERVWNKREGLKAALAAQGEGV